jgi:HPt (histidine-containing phosphotransfer) domain-containing protein
VLITWKLRSGEAGKWPDPEVSSTMNARPAPQRPRARLGNPADPATAFADPSDPIDRAHLARYSLGSPTLEREILGLFLAQLPLSIEQLQFAATDREWQVAAHTIKGSARAVGAWQVARLAQEAEQTSGAADEDERDRLLSALEEACELVQAYVDGAFPSERSPA